MTANPTAIAEKCVDKIIATAGVYDRSLRIDIIERIVRSLLTEDLPRETAAMIAKEFLGAHMTAAQPLLRWTCFAVCAAISQKRCAGDFSKRWRRRPKTDKRNSQ